MLKNPTIKVDYHPFASRPDLAEALSKSNIDPARLSTFQRIILTTNGTLTDILEAYLSEPILLVKLAELLRTLPEHSTVLALESGEEAIERKILLQGQASQRNWIYAESLLVPDRLEPHFRERLIVSQVPMGRLWLEHRLETFKEFVHLMREPAGDLADYFGLARMDMILSRTYRVLSQRQPIMVITEKFPEQFFLTTP